MEQEKPNNTIFEELKKIRNKKKIKLENIAKSSRIQLEYLEALETGEILKLPEVYDKLFFRSYIKYLGVDEDYYYSEFIKYRKKIRIDKTTTMIDFERDKEIEHKILNYKNLFVILPLVIVIFVIWFLVRSTEILETKPTQEVQEIDIQTIVEEIEKEKKAREDSLVEIQSNNLLNLDLNGLEKTWFRVVVDKSDTTEYLLNKGEHMRLQADISFEFLRIVKKKLKTLLINILFLFLTGFDFFIYISSISPNESYSTPKKLQISCNTPFLLFSISS